MLEKTTDGFEIAEADFALRGPGHVLGTRQSGKAALRVADPQRDREILEDARRRAFHLVTTERFDAPEWAMVKSAVLDRFGEVMDLAKTGVREASGGRQPSVSCGPVAVMQTPAPPGTG